MFDINFPVRTEVFHYLTGGRFNKKQAKIVQVTDPTATQAKAYDSYNSMLRTQQYDYSCDSCSLSSSENSYNRATFEIGLSSESLTVFSKEELLQQKIESMQELSSLNDSELLDLIGFLFEQEQKSPVITALYLRYHCNNLDNSAIRFTVANLLHSRHSLKIFASKEDSGMLKDKLAQLKTCLEIDQEQPTAMEWSLKINNMMKKNLLQAIEPYLMQAKIEWSAGLSTAELVTIKKHMIASESDSVAVTALQIIINSQNLLRSDVRRDQQQLLEKHLDDLKNFVPEEQKQQFESMALKLAHWLDNYKDGARAKRLCQEINTLIHDELLKHVQQSIL